MFIVDRGLVIDMVIGEVVVVVLVVCDCDCGSWSLVMLKLVRIFGDMLVVGRWFLKVICWC